uniref:Myomesin 1 n=1 Tax=Eptatretus burgeri TaxID=7764 RepID=A0A8C4R378_EPTBU
MKLEYVIQAQIFFHATPSAYNRKLAQHSQQYLCPANECQQRKETSHPALSTQQLGVEGIRDLNQSLCVEQIRKKLEYQREIIEARLIHAPNIGVPLRSHIVWEHTSVKFTCVVLGFPEPKVTWCKNNILIDPKSEPGKFRITSAYGVHSLKIGRCEVSDTAQYSISAVNDKGRVSCEATLVVKRAYHHWWLRMPSEAYFDISLLGRFPVSFGHEGESLHLGCSVLIHPPVPDYQPKIQWFRDGMLLEHSQWLTSKWDGERASINLHHLNKEDEGLYSLRVTAGKSSREYSAYVFVRDADAFVAGAPGAPLEVTCQDINRDYAVICWKHPSDDGGSAITGYYIERWIESVNIGTDKNWQRCNTTPTKLARFPVTGLSEGRNYEFRVRALNQRGLSRPSRVSEPITTLDPTEQAHDKRAEPQQVLHLLSPPPVEVSVMEASKDYIVLGWKPPKQGWREGLTYYIEKLARDGGVWERVNLGSPAHSPRFTMFNLDAECSYYFRVRACTTGAISEPSEPAGPIRLGDRLGVPSPPGRALPTRHTDTSVALSWEPTTDAEDLLGYYVDCCEEGTDKWLPCNNKFIAHGLSTGKKCTFRVRAMNAAGMSASSPASESIKVFAALARPSAPYDLSLLASTCDSMVISWKAPKTNGGACISAYYIDYREVCNGEPGPWMEGISTCVTPCAYQVSHDVWMILFLFFAETFQISCSFFFSHHIKVKGLKDGKNYVFRVKAQNSTALGKASECSDPVCTTTRPGECRMEVQVCGYVPTPTVCTAHVSCRGRLYLLFPSEKDLGTYSCMVTDTDGYSASIDLDKDGTLKLFGHLLLVQTLTIFLSPYVTSGVPLVSDLSVELLERGRVHFWLQAKCLGPTATAQFYFNNQMITSDKKYDVRFDRESGLVEMFMDCFAADDMGTYTVQLRDEKANTQSSLVLIGDVFDKLLSEAEFLRREWIRKQGPHFAEYLRWEVTEHCDVLLLCKVITCTHIIKSPPVRLSLFIVIFLVTAESATPLKMQPTAEGIKLYSHVAFYPEELKISWNTKLASTDKTRSGVTHNQIWLLISNPNDRDKGRYNLELFDGKKTHQRTIELAGDGEFFKAVAVFLNCSLIPYVPQTLNLTCSLWGDPTPEVCWMHNDRELELDEHFSTKFEDGRHAAFTIRGVHTVHSGKYSIRVRNKFGGETGRLHTIHIAFGREGSYVPKKF